MMPLILANAQVVHGDPTVAPRLTDILLRDGRIAAVGERRTFDATDAEVLDLTGRALLPGLIDLHVHLCLTGAPRSDELYRTEAPERLIARMVGLAQRHLHAGVTTIRDLGGPEPGIFVVRDAIADGLVEGPRVLAAGLVVTTTDGHGSWIGAIADDLAGIQVAVNGRIDSGADAIKITSTGGVHTRTSDLMTVQYSEEELRAGVHAAHARGRTVATHASNPRGMQNAIRAGVDTIEHGVFLDDETADLMARRGTTFVPTLVATQLFEPRADHPEIPDYVREKAAVTVPAHRDNFPRAVHAGVTIAAGTDAGSTFVDHGLVALELEALTRFGLSPLEAIAAGTRNAARVIGLDDEIGTVDVGKAADLLVVDGDPTERIANLRNVGLVVRSGRVVHSRWSDVAVGARST